MSKANRLPEEVLSRHAHRKSKEALINSELMIRQMPHLGEVLIHLVHQIEDLELEARHQDEKIMVLGRRLQKKRRFSKG